VGQTLSAAEFQQANLPTYKAGIGLRSAGWSADAAFVASVLETADLRQAMLGRVLVPPGMALARAELTERLADSPVDLDTLLSAPPTEPADRSHGLSSPSPGEVPAPAAAPPSGRHIQHTLLQPLDELSFRSLLETQPIRSRARLQATSRRGASDWLAPHPPHQSAGLSLGPSCCSSRFTLPSGCAHLRQRIFLPLPPLQSQAHPTGPRGTITTLLCRPIH
jgi:hypothetical protein